MNAKRGFLYNVWDVGRMNSHSSQAPAEPDLVAS